MYALNLIEQMTFEKVSMAITDSGDIVTKPRRVGSQSVTDRLIVADEVKIVAPYPAGEGETKRIQRKQQGRLRLYRLAGNGNS